MNESDIQIIERQIALRENETDDCNKEDVAERTSYFCLVR